MRKYLSWAPLTFMVLAMVAAWFLGKQEDPPMEYQQVIVRSDRVITVVYSRPNEITFMSGDSIYMHVDLGKVKLYVNNREIAK